MSYRISENFLIQFTILPVPKKIEINIKKKYVNTSKTSSVLYCTALTQDICSVELFISYRQDILQTPVIWQFIQNFTDRNTYYFGLQHNRFSLKHEKRGFDYEHSYHTIIIPNQELFVGECLPEKILYQAPGIYTLILLPILLLYSYNLILTYTRDIQVCSSSM